MVNGPAQIFVEHRGRLLQCDIAFENSEHLMRVIHRMLLPLGERVDQRAPRSDVRLPDGSMLSVIIPPLVLNCPCLTLRRVPSQLLTIHDLIHISEVVHSQEHGYELRDIIAFKSTGTNAQRKITGEHVLVNPLSDEWRERLERANGFLPPFVLAQTAIAPDGEDVP
ncbi:Flp pilus assembly complex ATPase component TadA [Chloroflexales bacterium ZM16-3]|nr:Flp pilus assembly complex ATPase component TadA [Chloroflexales bacterium ZM16-3]